MTLQVIGAGVGRSGTNSLRLALNTLGFGPCYHMYEVGQNPAVTVPLWQSALDGKPDWARIFQGYGSAVDWPVAGFFRELHAQYPAAKFILTVRDPMRWAESFSQTIQKSMLGADQAPPMFKPWFDMAIGVVAKSGFSLSLGLPELAEAFEANTRAVKAAIPADQLLTYQVKDGWEPLCAFLGVPVPDEPFPVTNSREEFWEAMNAALAMAMAEA